MKYTFPVAIASDVLHENEQTYIFMAGEHYLAELRTTASAMPRCSGPFAQMSQEDWWRLEITIESALPARIPAAHQEIASLLCSKLAHLRQWKNGLLRARINQATGHILGLLHPDEFQKWGPPAVFAVSPLWNRRLAAAVGGSLLPAWIGNVTLPLDP